MTMATTTTKYDKDEDEDQDDDDGGDGDGDNDDNNDKTNPCCGNTVHSIASNYLPRDQPLRTSFPSTRLTSFSAHPLIYVI